jgi:hypothetical protein
MDKSKKLFTNAHLQLGCFQAIDLVPEDVLYLLNCPPVSIKHQL